MNRDGRGLHVRAAGPLALIEDEGRPGYGAMGVSPSGAADRAAYRLGQRLVGDPAGLAAIELLLGGFAAQAVGALTVALTGAPAPLRVDGREVAHGAPVPVPDGALVEVGMPPTGLRSYLAVRGGLEVTPVLGSRSTDTLSGLGPEPLVAGMLVPVGIPRGSFPDVDHAPARPASAGPVTLDVLPGPRTEWLADPGPLVDRGWQVGAASDRVGVRLVGEVVARHTDRVGAEVPSEGLVRGAIQLPPDGAPVILLADHPVTGGYPVVGVLTAAACDHAAQLRPGEPVRLRWRHRLS